MRFMRFIDRGMTHRADSEVGCILDQKMNGLYVKEDASNDRGTDNVSWLQFYSFSQIIV